MGTQAWQVYRHGRYTGMTGVAGMAGVAGVAGMVGNYRLFILKGIDSTSVSFVAYIELSDIATQVFA